MQTTERNRPYLVAAACAVAACAALLVDVPVARFTEHYRLPGDVRKLLDVSEVFAHGLGVAMILITVAVLDAPSRRRLPRVATCAFGAGIIVQIVKHIVPRVRPNAFDTSADVFSSFLPWGARALEQAETLGSSTIQSFPSGHTATAVGLALGLAWLYPRGRRLFATFAVLAAMQRVQSSAHFVSDTLAAAAIGSLVAGLVLGQNALGRWFTRFETPFQEELDNLTPVHCSMHGQAAGQRFESGNQSIDRRHAS